MTKPARLVYLHNGDMEDDPTTFKTTVTFTPQDGKTIVTMRAVFPTVEQYQMVVEKYGALEGGKQTLGRLAEHVESMEPGVQPFVIARSFNAPRDLVWKAWTERDRLVQWFGPKGFTMKVATLDLRPGGVFHYCMSSPDGKEMWGKFVYREIVPPERIVLVNSFSDATGGIIAHPMSPTWPREMLSTSTFTEKDGTTTLTLECKPIHATEEERKTFDAARAGMTQGWAGTFEQLDAYLAKN